MKVGDLVYIRREGYKGEVTFVDHENKGAWIRMDDGIQEFYSFDELETEKPLPGKIDPRVEAKV